MQAASFLLSLCLHIAVFLLLWFWPTTPPLHLERPPVMISLVDGAPGGNKTPSPILGHMGEPGDGPMAPTPPAPKNEVAAPARDEVKETKPQNVPPKEAVPTPSKPELKKPEPKKEPKPEPKPQPEPKPEAKPVSEQKKEKPKPEEKPKPADKPKPKEEKQEKPKEPQKDKKPEKDQKTRNKDKPPQDPVAAALQQARRKASSRSESGDRGNAVEQALAAAQRRAGGNRGGGGGEGTGPGGGGLGDVYVGQVMLAVRPNWGFTSARRLNLSCVIRVDVDMQGKVQNAVVSRSSGNHQFDASAVNAVMRTSNAGNFPPPPSREYCDLELVFTYDEMMGR